MHRIDADDLYPIHGLASSGHQAFVFPDDGLPRYLGIAEIQQLLSCTPDTRIIFSHEKGCARPILSRTMWQDLQLLITKISMNNESKRMAWSKLFSRFPIAEATNII
jgi:hypothetical protein